MGHTLNAANCRIQWKEKPDSINYQLWRGSYKIVLL